MCMCMCIVQWLYCEMEQMKETIQYMNGCRSVQKSEKRKQLGNRLRQNQNQRNEKKNTFTHTNTAKSYDAITCVRIKYHHNITHIPQLICQLAHSLHSLLFFIFLHSLWITHYYSRNQRYFRHCGGCRIAYGFVFFCLFSWWLCSEMVLCLTDWDTTRLRKNRP